jgi:hypothetical protein
MTSRQIRYRRDMASLRSSTDCDVFRRATVAPVRSELQQTWRERPQFTNKTCLRRNTSSKIPNGFRWVPKQGEVVPWGNNAANFSSLEL